MNKTFLILLGCLMLTGANAMADEIDNWARRNNEIMYGIEKGRYGYELRLREWGKCLEESEKKASRWNRFWGKYGDECGSCHEKRYHEAVKDAVEKAFPNENS